MLKENDKIIDEIFGKLIYNGYYFQRIEKIDEEELADETLEDNDEEKGSEKPEEEQAQAESIAEDEPEKTTEKVTLFNEEYDLDLIVQHVYNAPLCEFMISKAQRDTYKIFQDILNEEEDTMTQAIENYAQTYFEDFDPEEDLEDYLEPTHIYFNAQAQLGILFETKYDPDNGVALFFQDNTTRNILIDTQNMFI